MRKYLETVTRVPAVFLVPLLAVPIVALIATLTTGQRYEMSALVWVEPSPYLDPFTSSRATANKDEAQALRERLETEAFRMEVLELLGVAEAIRQGQWPVPSNLQARLDSMGIVRNLPGLRPVLKAVGLVPPVTMDERLEAGLAMMANSIRTSTRGANLLRVTYSGNDPQLGPRLVEVTLDLFNQKTLEIRAQEARTGTDFYTRQLEIQRERMDAATKELQDFLQQHPEPLPGQTRPVAETARQDELERTVLLVQTLYDSALRRLEEVRVTGDAAITTRKQTFQVIDSPRKPEMAGTSKKAIIVAVGFGLVIGGMLGAVPIIFLTWQDNTVRSASDLHDLVNPKLIMYVPEARGNTYGGRHWVRRLIAHEVAGTGAGETGPVPLPERTSGPHLTGQTLGRSPAPGD